jgi:hypothetical protein
VDPSSGLETVAKRANPIIAHVGNQTPDSPGHSLIAILTELLRLMSVL